MSDNIQFTPADLGWFVVTGNSAALTSGGPPWLVGKEGSSELVPVNVLEVTDPETIRFSHDYSGGPAPDVKAWISLYANTRVMQDFAHVRFDTVRPSWTWISGNKTQIRKGGPNAWRVFKDDEESSIKDIVIDAPFIKLHYDPDRGPEDGPRIWVALHGWTDLRGDTMRIHLTTPASQ